MACSKTFYARHRMLELHMSLPGFISNWRSELKMCRVAISCCMLTILISVIIMVNKLVHMEIVTRSHSGEILRDVNHWQSDTNKRLSLAMTKPKI